MAKRRTRDSSAGDACAESLQAETRAIEFVEEAHKHCKAIAATGSAVYFLKSTRVGASIAEQDPAVIISDGSAKAVAVAFVEAISRHRNWERELRTLPNG